MTEEQPKRKPLMERLKHTYRLVIMNNETFEEIGSYRLTLLNVYILLSMLVVLGALLVLSLVIFTPLKRMIPGYGDVNLREELVLLNEEIDSLGMQLQAEITYSEALRRRLSGEFMPESDLEEPEGSVEDSVSRVERIEADEQLRKEVQLAEIRNNTQRGNNGFTSQEVPLEQQYFVPPITGEISAGFMPDKEHYGVDILAPANTPIKATMDGWVIASDWTLETGNTITIQHANNIVTSYKHNSMLLKKIGSYVKAGEAVAIIGNTGTLTDGPHLHFELWHKGKPVDPEAYVNFN